METRTIIPAPSSGYALVALFADVETTQQASDLKMIASPVVAFSIDSAGTVWPIPVRPLGGLDETDSEFRMVALQNPDGTLLPLTRAWAHGSDAAEQTTQRAKAFDSLPAFKAFAFTRFQNQRDSMQEYTAAGRQREIEKAQYAQQVVAVQTKLRQDNAERATKRLAEIEEAQRLALERAAQTAATIAQAAKGG
jgi:hypothetical protein